MSDEQLKMFEKEELENKTNDACRSCMNKDFKPYETRNIWYCLVTVDNKTECGFKKIKLKDKACGKYKFCYEVET
jgi:hypothetical protein